MEIRPNQVKQKLATGEIAYVVSGFTHPDDIDAFGPVGFDGIWLEGEHGPVDAAELGNLTRACDIWGMTSVVRVSVASRNIPALSEFVQTFLTNVASGNYLCFFNGSVTCCMGIRKN